MIFTLNKQSRRVTPQMIPGLVEDFRRTHNETHEYILLEAMEHYDVYLPFYNTNRVLLLVDRSSKKGVLVNGTVFSGANNAMAKQLSANKITAQQMAEQCGIPTLKTAIINSTESAGEFWVSTNGNCILKPLGGRMSKDVLLNFKDIDDYIQSYKMLAVKGSVIAQEKIDGLYDLRTLFIGGKFVAAAARKTFSVTGDGLTTFADLINRENMRRQKIIDKGHQEPLLIISPEELGAISSLEPSSVIPEGTTIQLATSNIAQGRYVIEFTDNIHPWFVAHGEKLAQFYGFDTLSVDFIVKDIYVAHDQHPQAFFMETNARPNIILHHRPHEGLVRNVAREYLKHVFSSPNTIFYEVRGTV
jgi:cyanophycin synthetase